VDLALLSSPARILVVNAGSSSLKLRVLGVDNGMVASSDLPPIGTREVEAGLRQFVRENSPVDAVGHRVVHGGPEFRTSVIVSDDVLERLRALSELAPLHNPPALAALDEIGRLVPRVPHVACFDTAFHADLPEKAATYGIPFEWTERWNVRRYGFHGLSHAYAAGRTAEVLGRPVADLQIVTCHLGAGASLAAVAGGRSVDTTMGFTPLEGLVMATRSGSVDPGALLWLQRRVPMPAEVMEEALEQKAGLLGISGVSGDMRRVLEAADRGERRAELALDVYLHRLRAGIAAMAAAMDGLDALTFTGGVGEGSARIRRDACARLGFLGLALDSQRNAGPGQADSDLSASGAQVRVVLVRAREDLEIAREVRRILATAGT
jgi:acetate kinase